MDPMVWVQLTIRGGPTYPWESRVNHPSKLRSSKTTPSNPRSSRCISAPKRHSLHSKTSNRWPFRLSWHRVDALSVFSAPNWPNWLMEESLALNGRIPGSEWKNPWLWMEESLALNGRIPGSRRDFWIINSRKSLYEIIMMLSKWTSLLEKHMGNVHLQKTQVILFCQYGNFSRISTLVHCLFATFSLKFPSSPSIQLFSMQVSDWIITSHQSGAFQVSFFFSGWKLIGEYSQMLGCGWMNLLVESCS